MRVLAIAPSPTWDAFRLGLRELAYVEGKNAPIEYRWSEGRAERSPGLAVEVVRPKADVVVTPGTPRSC